MGCERLDNDVSAVDAVFEVLLALRDPPEPKRPLREAIALDTIQYIYAGGSIETLPQGTSGTHSALTRGAPTPTLIRDPTVRSLLPRLPCASISAHPAITPMLRKRILSLPVSRTMEDLRCFLFWGKRDDRLARAVTKQHLPAAMDAYRTFVDSIAASSARRHSAEAHTPWIVPSQYVQAVVGGQLDDLPLAAQRALMKAFGIASNDTDPEWRVWLPHLTLGAASTLRNMSWTTLRALNHALVALVEYMSPKATSNSPWACTFPKDLRPVPTYAMFPFRPVAAVRKAITNLATKEIRTVGDLQCLHPKAIRLAKEPSNPLARLYAAFEEASRALASDFDIF